MPVESSEIVATIDPEAAKALLAKIKGEANEAESLKLLQSMMQPKAAFDSKKFKAMLIAGLTAAASLCGALVAVPGPVGAYAGIVGTIVSGVLGAVYILVQGKQDVAKLNNAPAAISALKK